MSRKSYNYTFVHWLESAKDMQVELSDNIRTTDRVLIALFYNLTQIKSETHSIIWELARIAHIDSDLLKSDIAEIIAENLSEVRKDNESNMGQYS